MSSRTSNSIKNIASGFGLKIILLFLQFATKTFFIRYLSDFIGINSLLCSIISYLNITELGISTSINFAMYKPIANNDSEKVCQYLAYYKRVYHFIGIIVLGIGVILAFFIPFMLDINEVNLSYMEIYIIYVLYLINAIYPYYVYADRGGFITASQEDYRLTPINYSTTIGTILLQMIVLITIPGTFFSFVLYTAIPIVLCIIRSFLNGIFAAKWHPYINIKPVGKLDKNEIKDMYKNTYGISIAKISTIVNNSIDSIIISAYIGINVLGNYSLYNTLIGMVASFTSIAFSAIIPSVGNLNNETNTEHKKYIFNAINLCAFWIHAVTALCYIVGVQSFMNLWAGENKVMMVCVPAAVSINFLTHGMTSAVSAFREGAGLYFQGRFRPVFSTAVNVILSFLLGSIFTKQFGDEFGVFGIILATIISRMCVIWWFDAYIVFKYIFCESPVKYLKQYTYRLIAVLFTGVMAFVLTTLINSTALVEFIISSLICFFVVNCAFILIYHKTDEFKFIVSTINKIRRFVSISKSDK